MSIYDWSTTPASNTTVDGININTGCPAGNIDNAIRSLMALARSSFHIDLQTFLAGSAPLPAANGGTGVTTTAGLFVPAGAVFHFAMTSAPTGYLKCDGTAVSRATYATLFAAISTTFGAGNGSTTFNLPELRGEFIRGYDDGRGADSGRVFGAYQADELKSHNHRPIGQSFGFGSSGNGNALSTNATDNWPNNTTSTGGSETRPRNLALLACIKY